MLSTWKLVGTQEQKEAMSKVLLLGRVDARPVSRMLVTWSVVTDDTTSMPPVPANHMDDNYRRRRWLFHRAHISTTCDDDLRVAIDDGEAFPTAVGVIGGAESLRRQIWIARPLATISFLVLQPFSAQVAGHQQDDTQIRHKIQKRVGTRSRRSDAQNSRNTLPRTR